MNTNIDLNALRSRVLANQDANTTRPTDTKKSVVVDRDGKIRLGDQSSSNSGPESIVPQEVFADRLRQDRRTANTYLPRNTREITTDEGITGFVYRFSTELNDEFTLFAYFDGANYQVQVVKPEVEERFKSPHTGHLFSSGRICFGDRYDSGMPTLRDAYSKSVLWANGMSVAMHDEGHFAFSNND